MLYHGGSSISVSSETSAISFISLPPGLFTAHQHRVYLYLRKYIWNPSPSLSLSLSLSRESPPITRKSIYRGGSEVIQVRSYLTLSNARIFLRTLANLWIRSEDKRVTIDRFSQDVTTFLSEILTIWSRFEYHLSSTFNLSCLIYSRRVFWIRNKRKMEEDGVWNGKEFEIRCDAL